MSTFSYAMMKACPFKIHSHSDMKGLGVVSIGRGASKVSDLMYS